MSKVVDREILNQVLPHYNCSLNNSTVSTLGNGLINSTYLVRSINASFVLQRINNHVFQLPEQVINNAELINLHLLKQKEQGNYSLESIGQISSNKNTLMVDIESGYWRAIQFIPNCYSVEEVETPKQALQAATAFAQFTSALSDFPANQLIEIIPNFHNLTSRIEQLQQAIKKDEKGRLAQCQDLVNACLSQQSFIEKVSEIVKNLPIQVTHNDTKINNLLFNTQTNSPVAVIDLDTCMPGFVMHDFGDMVRTCCSNLPEDGTELEQMAIRLDIFSALTAGYVETFADKLSSIEKESLVIGAQLMPFMVATRFLADFLNGDSYFQINHPQHNLERAKNQFHLYKLLHSAQAQLNDIVLTV